MSPPRYARLSAAFESVEPACADDDVESVGGELARSGRADAGTRSGDDGDAGIGCDVFGRGHGEILVREIQRIRTGPIGQSGFEC